ncbi:DNA polymerase III subunit beta [Alicyclobacillus macrosporangiidus]|uniref:Beta sliding clamp n=1 Tax=Alicyclobacillus macrosporangiidus TaxID=392015 RepID=A0A1I7KET7_9BACL|nr:DNA polymerase III subunit beta [Alicyclobacillus macrosporangiidus]SFU95916.1 DNA polymerase III, beta subunit [Alicyclobacillus macrosporangiidus]
MKATFNNTELEKVLRDLVRVVPTSTNKAVLRHVLIQANKDEDRVDFYASSEDMSVRRTLFQEAANSPVTIEKSGTCLLPAKELHEIVKRASGQITLHQTAGRTSVTFGNAKYELAGLDPKLFTPYGDDPAESTTAVILAPDLFRLLRRTTYAAAKGEARPALTGVLLKISDTTLHGVATDGIRLALYNVPCQEVSGDERSLPVPAALLDKLAAVLPAHDDDEEITFSIGSSSCTVSWGDDAYRMVIRGLSTGYPDVSRIIPQQPGASVIIDRATLLEACERVSILSETEHQRAEFTFFADRVVVSATSAQYGTAKHDVDVVSSTITSELSLLCNINYWIGLLRSSDGVKQVEVGLDGPNKPITVKPVGDGGLGLIAPLFTAQVEEADRAAS